MTAELRQTAGLRQTSTIRLAAALSSAFLVLVWVGITPADAATSHPASPGNYQADVGQTFLIGPEPANWNPHAAAADAIAAPGSAGATQSISSAASQADGDVVGAAPELDDILGPVLPSVFDVQSNYSVHLNTTFVTSATETDTSRQTVVYQINPQATWSDGTPITYQDFVYNWQADSGSAAYTDLDGQPYTPATTDGYRQIASVSESGGDPYRVKVVFKHPYRDWQSLFSLMVPAHVAEQVGFDTGFTDPVDDVSGGAFLIQSYTPGISVTLVRNPRYWGVPANLAEVTFRFVADPDQAMPTLLAGDANAGVLGPSSGLKASLLQAVSRHPVPGSALTGFAVSDVAGPVWQHLDFNQDNAVLGQLAARRAIMLAVNRAALIVSTIGRDDPTVKPLGSLVFVPGQPGYRNDAGVYGAGDISGARAALLQAGFAYKGKKLIDNGDPVTLDITADAGDPLLAAEEKVIATQLGAIGIAVTEHDSTDLPATLKSGDYDLAIVSSQASPFPSAAASRYQTNQGTGPGAENYLDYSSSTTDNLIARAEAAGSDKAQLQAYGALDAHLFTDAVSLPLFQYPQLLVYNKQYTNMVNNPAPGGLTAQMAKWGIPVNS
jgi:peptide/nickel transport system substrate-binding protein